MIKEIYLKNFRKYSNFNININKNLVIIVGDNACGKTTILESIYLISKAKSHRTNDFKSMIKENEKFSIINIKDEANEYKLVISQQGKTALINNIEYKKISEFIGNIKAIMFSPNDLNLIYGSKSERRQFIDIEESIIDKNYIYLIKNFKKILKERNEILKIYDDSKKIILDVITKQLIEISKKIIKYRSNFINELNEYLNKVHKNLYNEDVNIKYLSNVTLDNIDNIYETKLSYDLMTKITNYGIHRDDFIFEINKKNASLYASQGQVRSIVLSVKLALFYMVKNKFGKNILLLLDDVFSELDINRQNNLIRFLINENQTFISTTNIDLIPNKLKEQSQIIYLEKE
ncbi:MAG: DNA replication/repair protein RecF [Anaeroplasmataceae bacterium]